MNVFQEINDIVHSSNILKFILFADDTTIFYSSKLFPEAQHILDIELNNVNQWLICNKLSLNTDKSCYLRFSHVKPPNLINEKIAKNPLKHKKYTKYLGVILDDKLTWKNHIDNINLKIRRGIGMLSKVKDFVSSSTLKSLYYSCIYPYLDYNLLNWSSTSTSNLNCLRFSIKKAVRVILSKNKQEHSTPLVKYE